MHKVFRVLNHGRLETSYAVSQTQGPWVSLAGDCYFRGLHEDFSSGPLRVEDCPFTMSFPRGRIEELMNLVENFLPPTTGLLIVNVGANNIASTRYPARAAASILLDRCLRLLRFRPHLREISICLLSPRTVDDHGEYSEGYIAHYNEKAACFNGEIVSRLQEMPAFSYIDFKLEEKNLWFLLRETGFGVNNGGRQTMAQTLQAIIIWKRLVGEGIRRGESFVSDVPDRLFNLPYLPGPPFGPQARSANRPYLNVPACQPLLGPPVPPPNLLRVPILDPPPICEVEPWLNPPLQWSNRREPLPVAPASYSDRRLQGEFRSYIQDFTWSNERQVLFDRENQSSSAFCEDVQLNPNMWTADCDRRPLVSRPAKLTARPLPLKKLSRLTRKPSGKRTLKSIRKARVQVVGKTNGRPSRNRV